MHFVRLKTSCIFFLCILFFTPILGQTDITFSQKQLSEQHTFIEEHLYKLHDIEKYIDLFLQQSLKENNDVFTAKAYYYLSKVNRKKRNLTRALEEINQAISIIDHTSNQYTLSRFFHHKGAIYYLNSNYSEALVNYLKADSIGKTHNTIEDQLILDYDIAMLKLNTKNTKTAIRVFEKTTKSYDSLLLKKPEKLYLKKRYINMLLGLGKAYTVDSSYAKALTTYNKSLYLSNELNYAIGVCYSIGGKGNVLTTQKKYTDAVYEIQKAKKIADSLKLNRVLPYLLYDEGKCFYAEKKYRKAIFSFTQSDSITTANQLNFLELNELYKFIAQSHIHLGEHIKANKVYDTYVKRNSLDEKERLKLYQKIFKDYDLKKVQEEADHATKKSIVFEKYFLVTAVTFVGALIFAIIFFFNYRKKQQENISRFEHIINELKSKSKPKNKKHALSDEKASKILASLDDFETNLMFLNNKYDLNTLAKKCNTNSNYLSKVINKYKGKKFSEYMSDLRIDYVLVALKEDKKLRSYTIQSIAQEIGFNKAESFAKSFKKRTGLNPSYYIKSIGEMNFK